MSQSAQIADFVCNLKRSALIRNAYTVSERFAVFELDDSVERVWILCVLAEISGSYKLEFFAGFGIGKRFFDLAVFKRLDRIGVEIVVEGLAFGDCSGVFDIEQIVVNVHGDVGAGSEAAFHGGAE